jgi:hypothetical protein
MKIMNMLEAQCIRQSDLQPLTSALSPAGSAKIN